MTDVCPFSYNLLPMKRMLFVKYLQGKKSRLVSSILDEQVFQAGMKITGALKKHITSYTVAFEIKKRQMIKVCCSLP